MPASYYDDNFGFYDIDDEDDIQFYNHMQQTNVQKECVGCGQTVLIQPDYDVCNSCADKRERGFDF